MKGIYYVPKLPDSIPFIDKEAGVVELWIDGEAIEISLSLFNKLFVEKEVEQARQESKTSTKVETDFFSMDMSSIEGMKSSLKLMTEQLKQYGVSKEDLKGTMKRVLDGRNLPHAESMAMDLIEELYGD